MEPSRASAQIIKNLITRSREMQYSILIIEDKKIMKNWIAEVLEMANYKVLKAENGKTGVELAHSQQPDLILCNIMLPEFDGYQVLYLLSKNPKTAIIPFIFLIAIDEVKNFNTRKGMEMGADDFLIQPFNTMELLNAIESRLSKKEKEKTFYEKMSKEVSQYIPEEGGWEDFEKMCKICSNKVKYIKRKQIIYYEGDPAYGIYLIISGLVKITKRTNDGREMLTNIYGPQEYLGLSSMLLNEPYHVTAQALEDTSLTLLPKDLVNQLLKRFPDLNYQFYKILADDIWEKEEQILQLAYYSVRKRVAEVLLRLVKHKDKEMKSSTPVVLEMSGDDLAAMAGVSTETISRVLSGFKEDGIIRKEGSYIYILDQIHLNHIKN